MEDTTNYTENDEFSIKHRIYYSLWKSFSQDTRIIYSRPSGS